MFPVRKSFFKLLWLVSKHCSCFIDTHSTKSGTGSGFIHFLCRDRMDKREIQSHIICYLISNLRNAHALNATNVKDTVRWAISGGCRAIFSSFGMQKTVTQLEILRVVLKHKGGKGLIVCPKRVVVEFLTQAEQHLHMKVTYVRAMADVMICPTDIMVTNY